MACTVDDVLYYTNHKGEREPLKVYVPPEIGPVVMGYEPLLREILTELKALRERLETTIVAKGASLLVEEKK
jgi:hypothetical protein